MKRFAATILCSATGAWAHDGHGMDSVHWHATDTFGFMLLAALVAVGVWLFRRK